MSKGLQQVRKSVGRILAESASGLSGLGWEILQDVAQRLGDLDARMTAYNAWIVRVCPQVELCQCLSQVAGVGPLTATALYTAMGNAQAFDNGRHVSAWLGLVPEQHASGEHTVLLGTHKRGDRYLRTLFMHRHTRATHATPPERESVKFPGVRRIKLPGSRTGRPFRPL